MLAGVTQLAHVGVLGMPSSIAQGCSGLSNGTYHCQVHSANHNETRNIVSGSPFHDCLGLGKTWHECRLAVQELVVQIELESIVKTMNTTSTIPRNAQTTMEKRITPSTISGVLNDLGISFGQSEQCYSVNSLGSTGWLTNTAVSSLKKSACTAAVAQALNPVSGKVAGLGYFTKTLAGYYQANGGPIVDPKVGFYLSTLFSGDYMDLAKVAAKGFNLNQLGIDLCMKGMDHLLSDSGCTATRKAGVVKQHTSVNGGEFNYAHGDGTVATDAPAPKFDSSGACTNCMFQMFMEASNNVDKDGTTSVPEDKSS